MGIAKGSNQELLEDYQDYLKQHGLNDWAKMEHQRQRYEKLLAYCRTHNDLADYDPYFAKWTDEEMANTAITLCHMVDKAMTSFLAKRDREFVEEGGIRERMHRARTAYRQQQDARLKQLEEELPRLKQALTEAQAEAAKWKAAFEDIKQRALKAYYRQEAEIKRLKEKLDSLEGSKEI